MTQMIQAVLGIDIAKATYAVELLQDGRSHAHSFKNQPKEFMKLGTWLRKHEALHVHACMEATGRYGEALAKWLREQGHQISLVNPMAMRAYADSQLTRNKTDKLDAALIARYCLKEQPAEWTPAPLEVAELQSLLQELETLQTAHVAERNRLQSGISSEAVLNAIRAHLSFLEAQIESFRQLINDHIQAHPHLKQQHALLCSIPGIGDITASRLVAAQLERFEDARAVSAFAGLSPQLGESGTSVHRKTRLCKLGHAGLRKALYFPAMTALRFNPIVKALGERLTQRHKHKMVVIGAAMHKLLCLAYGVLKSGIPFDPDFLNKHLQSP